MQDSSRPVTGYPVSNANGCAPNNPPPQPPPSAAYPYQNPNPYPTYPYYHAPPHPNPRALFFRRLLVASLFLLLTFGVILFIFWLVLRPHLPDFSIQSLSLSNFNSSNQHLTATWNARFQVSNPNKKISLSYYELISSLYYKDYYIVDTRIQPFDQGTRDVRTVDASYSVADTYVDGKVLDAVNGDKSRGEVKFVIKVLAGVKFRYGSWQGRRRVLRVRCDDVPINGTTGKMVGGARDCRVD